MTVGLNMGETEVVAVGVGAMAYALGRRGYVGLAMGAERGTTAVEMLFLWNFWKLSRQ